MCMVALALFWTSTADAQGGTTAKPFGLPFDTPPGPSTWLLSQQYGNTLGAFNFGRYWYAAGQDLHFGVDFWAPCNTPVRAIGDGEIDQVDNMSFGLEPHNVTIFHRDLKLTSLYGHLYVRSTMTKGQPVRKGDVIGYSGDPDKTCKSRPHLHLEVRSSNYSTAYNPMQLIDADWTSLSSIGYQRYGGFVKDLYYPNRWQTYYDQPEVAFNQNVLNNYPLSWPPPERNAPSAQARLAFTAPIPADAVPVIRRLTKSGCCSQPWWSPDGGRVRFWDGPDGKLAAVYEVGPDPATDQPEVPQKLYDAPQRIYSPDGQWSASVDAQGTTLTRLSDNKAFLIGTGGAWPQFSPGSKRILWHRHPADDVPGDIAPLTEINIANADGSGRNLIRTQNGGSVQWLDDERVLIIEPVGRMNNEFALSIYAIGTRSLEKLTQIRDLRGLLVSPGGAVILFYAPFQDDAAASGIYGIVTQPGAKAVKLPFFGSYRWRDSVSLLYMQYGGGGRMALASYDITTGQDRRLTDFVFSVANDDWTVSPDGRHIVFWSASDSAVWSIRLW